MKEKNTPRVDEHLHSLQGMREAETDLFFYTRLKARMDKRREQPQWLFPLKPAWLIASLVLLLAVNGWMLWQPGTGATQTKTPEASTLQQFAASYDMTISSSY